MALNDEWVQELFLHNVTLEAPEEYDGTDSGKIGRTWIDGVLVIYDPEDVPAWLAPVMDSRDDDGNTQMSEPRAAIW